MTAGLNMLKNAIDSAEKEETIEVISLHLSAEAVSTSMGFTMIIEDRKFPQPLHVYDFHGSVMSELNDLMIALRAKYYPGQGVIEFIFNIRVLDPRGSFDFTLKCADFPVPKTIVDGGKVTFDFAQETKRGLNGILEKLSLNVWESRGVDVRKLNSKR